MQRKRPAQRKTSSRSVVKTKQRRSLPTRASRTSAKRSVADGLRSASGRSWLSKRKKSSSSRLASNNRSKSSGSQNSWWQTVLIWLVLVVIGGLAAWHIIIWGVVPRLLSVNESKTVAILPTTAGGEVLVVQIEPELKESTVFLLDGEETVTLPGEYGEYRLSAIYQLLLIDEKDERYFRGALNRVFGIFLDEEILVPGPLQRQTSQLKHQLRQIFWDKVVSDLDINLDLLRTWYILSYKNTVVDNLSAEVLVDELRMLNGGTFASRDECRVAILNSTNTPGLAGGLADIVERNGGIVIRLGQYSDTLEKSTLLYDPAVAECQEAIKQIETLSPVPFEIKEDSSVQNKFRAPLVAIIGQNFE